MPNVTHRLPGGLEIALAWVVVALLAVVNYYLAGCKALLVTVLSVMPLGSLPGPDSGCPSGGLYR